MQTSLPRKAFSGAMAKAPRSSCQMTMVIGEFGYGRARLRNVGAPVDEVAYFASLTVPQTIATVPIFDIAFSAVMAPFGSGSAVGLGRVETVGSIDSVGSSPGGRGVAGTARATDAVGRGDAAGAMARLGRVADVTPTQPATSGTKKTRPMSPRVRCMGSSLGAKAVNGLGTDDRLKP